MNLNEAAEIVRKPQVALDSIENSRNYIKAWELLGELRTLLRLCGATKKENDA